MDFEIFVNEKNHITATAAGQKVEGKLTLTEANIKQYIEQVDNSVFSSKAVFQKLGNMLYKKLFTDKKNAVDDEDSIGSLFRYHFKRYKDSEITSGLRIRLRIDENNYSAQIIPWELLAIRDYFLAPDENISIVRMPHNIGMVNPVKVTQDLRVLLIISVTDQKELAQARVEKLAIKELLKGAIIEILSTEKEENRKPTYKNIGDALLEGKFNIVHFIGHSEFVQIRHKDGKVENKARIMLTDKDGDSYPCSDDDFARLFNIKVTEKLALVVLNSCKSGREAGFSGLGLRLINRRIRCVVSMQYNVRFSSGHDFVSTFYGKFLDQGYDAEYAVNSCRSTFFEVRSGSDMINREFAAPVLYLATENGIILERGIDLNLKENLESLPSLGDKDPTSVSFTRIDIHPNHELEALERIALAINVEIDNKGQEFIPFVPPNNFDQWRSNKKILLYGLPNCGKSRIIYELIKENIRKFDRIYIINPRSSSGDYSGDITISNLINSLNIKGQKDLLIWNKFPDGLKDLDKDPDQGQNVLTKINSGNITNLLVSLKPQYIELYRNFRSLEMNIQEISYSVDLIKDLIKTYGNNVSQFRQIYNEYLERDLDEISNILWRREPTPYTVKIYYEDLVKQVLTGYVNPVILANSFSSSKQYYENSFRYIITEIPTYGDFLYALKLCYSLMVKRTPNNLIKLQKGIFGTDAPSEPELELRPWIYTVSGQYAMSDLAIDTIEFSVGKRASILKFLCSDKYINTLNDDFVKSQSFATFLGRNFDFVEYQLNEPYLPSHIYDIMNTKRGFKEGLARGAAIEFPSLSKEAQQVIWKLTETDLFFGYILISTLSKKYSALNKEVQNTLWRMAYLHVDYLQILGFGLGVDFPHLTKEIQKEMLEKAKTDIVFGAGFVSGLAFIFSLLSAEIQKMMWSLIEGNEALKFWFGTSLGYQFPYITKKMRNKILKRTDSDESLSAFIIIGQTTNFRLLDQESQDSLLHEIEESARVDMDEETSMGIIMIMIGVGLSLKSLNAGIQERIWNLATRNKTAAGGLCYGLGTVFFSLTPDIQARTWNLIADDPEGKVGSMLFSALGIQYRNQTADLRERLWNMVKENEGFAYGLGNGLGVVLLVSNDKDLQERIWTMVKENEDFALGLGYGMGIITFQSSPAHIQETAWNLVKGNEAFAYGLGLRLGMSFPYCKPGMQEKILAMINESEEFGSGVGIFLRESFSTLSKELQRHILDMVKGNQTFIEALGIKNTETRTRSTAARHGKKKARVRRSSSPARSRTS